MARLSKSSLWSKTTVPGVDQFRNVISESWKRCQSEYGLTSQTRPRVEVLDSSSTRTLQQKCSDLIVASEGECSQLYAQTRRTASIVVLTNADGIIMRTIGDPATEDEFKKSFLVPGAIWSEEFQGTNGMGTSLASNRLVNVHKTDHFFRKYSNLTCISAPIHDQSGKILGALDVTSMYPSFNTHEQQYTCNLVQAATNYIEYTYFKKRFRNATLLSFHPRIEAIGSGGEGLIALNENGDVVAINNKGVSLLQIGQRERVLGKNITDLFEAPEQLIDYRGYDSHRTASLSELFNRINGRRYLVDVTSQSRAARKSRVSVFLSDLGVEDQKTLASSRETFSFEEIAGSDEKMTGICKRLKRVLDKDINIVISGETGTGKEEIARTIHQQSESNIRPLVVLKCAGLSEQQLYDDLLEHSTGDSAATSAHDKQGGAKLSCTVLLDQVSDLSFDMQAQLLHVIQTNRLITGENKTGIAVDWRLISTDCHGLDHLVETEKFRADLYYRLNGLSIDVPPIRQRSDLRDLIQFVLTLESPDAAVIRIEDAAMQKLSDYSWPGNIRELRTVIRTALAMSDGEVLSVADFPDLQTHQYTEQERSIAGNGQVTDSAGALPPEVAGLSPIQLAERNVILQALEQWNWNLSKTAVSINMSRSTLYRKIKKYQIGLDR